MDRDTKGVSRVHITESSDPSITRHYPYRGRNLSLSDFRVDTEVTQGRTSNKYYCIGTVPRTLLITP